MFLTEAEVIKATGCIQPAAQENWFLEHGLNAYRNRNNEVIVAREAYVRWQLGEKPAKAVREPMLKMLANG